MTSTFLSKFPRARRIRAATALAAAGALVLSSGLVLMTGSAASATDTNQASTWQTLPGEQCTKVDDEGAESGGYTIASGPSPGYTYSKIILKKGSGDSQIEENTVIPNPVKGVTYYHATQRGYSHVILCQVPDVVAVPARPEIDDQCGPGNITFILPSDTDKLDWSLLQNGNATVAPKAPYRFDQDSQFVTFQLPGDSNVVCPDDVVEIPGTPDHTDPCGPNNVAFLEQVDTLELDWTELENGDLKVEPQSGFRFAGDSQEKVFELPTDTDEQCDEDEVVDVPAQPVHTDPCGPNNIAFDAQQDTAELDWTLLGNGDLKVEPKSGFRFAGEAQQRTFELPADTNEACIAGVEEIVAAVSFADPSCAKPNRTTWSGNFSDIVAYTVAGTPGRGNAVTVTATIKAAAAEQYDFPAGFDNTFEHTYKTLNELNCVKGSESSRPKPDKKPDAKPTVLGTQAGVPTAVAAGYAGEPAAATSTVQLLAQLMVGGGLLLLLAGGWLGLGRRETGAHQ